MLRSQELVQIVWLIATSPLVLRGFVRPAAFSSAIMVGAWALLALATVLLWRQSVVGLVMSAVIAASVAAITMPWAIYNFWAYATDHPRYVESPATILVVGIASLVMVVPAVVVVVLSLANRSRMTGPSGA